MDSVFACLSALLVQCKNRALDTTRSARLLRSLAIIRHHDDDNGQKKQIEIVVQLACCTRSQIIQRCMYCVIDLHHWAGLLWLHVVTACPPPPDVLSQMLPSVNSTHSGNNVGEMRIKNLVGWHNNTTWSHILHHEHTNSNCYKENGILLKPVVFADRNH